MKWQYTPTSPKLKVPPVGFFWRHSQSPNEIFLRIDTEVGRGALRHDVSFAQDRFYSVTESGNIVHTLIDDDDIEMLPADQITIKDQY